MRFTFKKDEKLKSHKLIERLFVEGQRLKSYPLQLVYLETTHTSEAKIQVGFSVPKRRFKRAVDRNRIKRLIREAYRLQKHNLKVIQDLNCTKIYIFMFVYIAKEELSYKEISTQMASIITKFNTK